MATPITHLVLAERYYDHFFKHLDKRTFMVGTSFPDMRYVANEVSRGDTHVIGLTPERIAKEPAFQAGVQFHVLIDMIQGQWFYNHRTPIVPQGEFAAGTLKVAQDILLYDHISNWEPFISYFSSILPEEKVPGAKTEEINTWHRLLQDYLKQKPNFPSILSFSKALGIPDTASNNVANKALELSKDHHIQHMTEALVAELDRLFLQTQ